MRSECLNVDMTSLICKNKKKMSPLTPIEFKLLVATVTLVLIDV